MFEWLQSWFAGWTDTQTKALFTLGLIITVWIVKRVVVRSIMTLQSDLSVRYTWRKAANYTLNVLTIIGIAVLWSDRFESLATFLGLLSAGLALAFRDPIVNMAGWYYIVAQKPFRLGDRIEIEGRAGDVVDINMFQFTIVEIGNWVRSDQSTGRIIHIPNSKVFAAPLANYDSGVEYIWNEIAVQITFESNWKKAKALLQAVLDQHAPKIDFDEFQAELERSGAKYLIYYSKVTPSVYTNVGEHGVVLCMRYLCRPKERRITEQQLWEHVLEQFDAHPDLNIAYTTRRNVTSAITHPKMGSSDKESDNNDMDGDSD